MNVKRREFLVAGGVALLALLQRSDAGSTTGAFGPDSTFQTPAPAGSLRPLAPNTFFGNSNPMGGQPAHIGMVPCDTQFISCNGSYVCNFSMWQENHISPSFFDATTGNTYGQRISGSFITGMQCGVAAPDNSVVYFMYGMQLCTGHLLTSGQPLISVSDPGGGWGPTGGVNGTTNVTLPGSNATATGIVLTGGNLYIVTPGPTGFVDRLSGDHCGMYSSSTATVSVVSTSNLNAVARSWTAPFARRIAVDRHGHLWVLQQAQATGTGSPRAGALACYTTTGKLIGLYTLPRPAVLYPVDIACDPNSDTILVADNLHDQNIKKYDTSGVASLAGGSAAAIPTTNGPNPGSSTVGVQFGYLDSTQATKGTIGANRFCGLRSICTDRAGNVYVAQNLKPGITDLQWVSQAKGTIFIKQDSSGNVKWMRHSMGVGGYGIQTQDGNYAFTDIFYCQRANADLPSGETVYDGWGGFTDFAGTYSQYLPIAVTMDPFTYPNDERRQTFAANANYCDGVYEWDANGTYHLVTWDGTNTLSFYRFTPGTHIMQLGTTVTSNPRSGTITVDGVSQSWTGWISLQDWCIDDSNNIWVTDGEPPSVVWRLRFQGYNSNGSPIYNSTNVDKFTAPSIFNGGSPAGRLMRIEVHGSSFYAGGYLASDPDSGNWGLKTLVKYPSLPTGAGTWPKPSWQTNIYSGSVGKGSNNLPQFFSVDPTIPVVAVAWRQPPKSLTGHPNGYYTFLNDTTGAQASAFTNDSLGWGGSGVPDMNRAGVCRNGYLWVEDDWGTKVLGVGTAGHGAP